MLLGVALRGVEDDQEPRRDNRQLQRLTRLYWPPSWPRSLLTFGLTLGRIPVTFSATMVGAFAGAAFASSAVLRVGDIATIIVFWAIAPIATMAVTFLSYKVIQRATVNLSLAFRRRLQQGGGRAGLSGAGIRARRQQHRADLRDILRREPAFLCRGGLDPPRPRGRRR